MQKFKIIVCVLILSSLAIPSNYAKGQGILDIFACLGEGLDLVGNLFGCIDNIQTVWQECEAKKKAYTGYTEGEIYYPGKCDRYPEKAETYVKEEEGQVSFPKCDLKYDCDNPESKCVEKYTNYVDKCKTSYTNSLGKCSQRYTTSLGKCQDKDEVYRRKYESKKEKSLDKYCDKYCEECEKKEEEITRTDLITGETVTITVKVRECKKYVEKRGKSLESKFIKYHQKTIDKYLRYLDKADEKKKRCDTKTNNKKSRCDTRTIARKESCDERAEKLKKRYQTKYAGCKTKSLQKRDKYLLGYRKCLVKAEIVKEKCKIGLTRRRIRAIRRCLKSIERSVRSFIKACASFEAATKIIDTQAEAARQNAEQIESSEQAKIKQSETNIEKLREQLDEL